MKMTLIRASPAPYHAPPDIPPMTTWAIPRSPGLRSGFPRCATTTAGLSALELAKGTDTRGASGIDGTVGMVPPFGTGMLTFTGTLADAARAESANLAPAAIFFPIPA